MTLVQEYNLDPPFFEQNRIPQTAISEKKILGVVLRKGRTTQSDIAQQTGLAQQSISRLTKGLLERGTLRIAGWQSNGTRGQPRMSVELVPDFAYTFGVSMMTDALSVVLMDFSGAVLDQQYCEMAVMSRSTVLDRIDRIVETFTQKHRIDPQRILGVGVGISGYHVGEDGRYNTHPALDDWALIDIETVFFERLGLPVWVENDGNAAAIGESLVGVGREYPSFVYLYIDAGIGGGIIVNYQLMRGRNGNAGEVGVILPASIYPQPNLQLLRHILASHGVEVRGVSDLLEKFDPDWPAVDEWIARTLDSFSLITSAVSAILDPDVVVFGGRIPKSLAQKLIPRIEIYDHHRRAQTRPLAKLVIAESTGNACAIGAAALPLEKLFFLGADAGF